jgi:hypothetical protein
MFREALATYLGSLMPKLGLALTLAVLAILFVTPKVRAWSERMPPALGKVLQWLPIALVALAAVAVAWRLRWVCDDALT